jgi:hypothetical protein
MDGRGHERRAMRTAVSAIPRKRSFRLVRPDTLAIEMETSIEERRRIPHDFAIAELVISKSGQVVRRLRPVPAGFVEIPLAEVS